MARISVIPCSTGIRVDVWVYDRDYIPTGGLEQVAIEAKGVHYLGFELPPNTFDHFQQTISNAIEAFKKANEGDPNKKLN